MATWEPSRRTSLPGEGLACSATGAGGPLVVLLHGMTESSSCFGHPFDDLGCQVLAVDMLGFGGSLRVAPPAVDGRRYGRAAQTAAVEARLRGLGVEQRPLVLVGHSAGAVLALNIAATGRLPVRAVLGVSAPLFDDVAEARAAVRRSSWAGRLAGAELLCRTVCERPRLGATVWRLLGPRWPAEVVRGGAAHLWESHRDALAELVVDSGYDTLLAEVGRHRVPVQLLQGAEDRMLIPGRSVEVASRHDHVTALPDVANVAHALPLQAPDAVVAAVRRLVSTVSQDA